MLFFLPFALLILQASAFKLSFVNKCSYTVWPAVGKAPGGKVDTSVKWGHKLSPGASISTTIGDTQLGIRAWGRTGCNSNGANCATGACKGGLVCTDAGITSHALLAEFGAADFGQWGGLRLSWDLSYVGGTINVPIKLTAADGQSVKCTKSSCPKTQAYKNPTDYTADRNSARGTAMQVTFCP